MKNRIFNLIKKLVGIPSVNQMDHECQKNILYLLNNIGFRCEIFKIKNVTNFLATRGKKRPSIYFIGHTDVVFSGDYKFWKTPPFEPIKINDYIFGRGSIDMKGSIVSFILSVNYFLKKYPKNNHSIGLILTSDEEGKAIYGVNEICNIFRENCKIIDYCILGEPTSLNVLGDFSKNGRRGSISCKIVIEGIQGHIAYNYLISNPIHLVIPIINEILKLNWNKQEKFFSPTNFQISHINSGDNLSNVTPFEVILNFNFRFSKKFNFNIIKNIVYALLNKFNINYKIIWYSNGETFIKKLDNLSNAFTNSIKNEMGFFTKFSTDGGTSDGRFTSKICNQLVEFGIINSKIHKPNECIKISLIKKLSNIFYNVIKYLLIK